MYIIIQQTDTVLYVCLAASFNIAQDTTGMPSSLLSSKPADLETYVPDEVRMVWPSADA